jgi:hypothetical protein
VLPILKRTPNKYHTNKDTVYIPTENGDIVYSRDEWNCIIDSFPELYSDNIVPPDTTYANSRLWVKWIDSLGNEQHVTFGCEVCRDAYYGLYAWFLKNKNGIAKHAARRKKLIEIYTSINRLFSILNSGGTYYGHQIPRIEGYVEYDIYRFIHKKALFADPSDFRQQKAQFISTLQQNFAKDDPSIKDEYQRKRILEMRELIHAISKDITDYYFLETARLFRKDNYNYP